MLKRKTKKRRKFFIIFFFMLLSISFFLLEAKATPIILATARNNTHSVATSIIQDSILEKFSQTHTAYDELMHIERDRDGKIVLLIPNTLKINETVSELTADIDHELSKLDEQKISVPLGVITNSKLLSALGPKIKVRVQPIGAVHITVLDDFVTSGINQSRHRIWLDISVEMSIAIPFDKNKFKVESSVLLCEGIIVGPVPQTYLNFAKQQ